MISMAWRFNDNEVQLLLESKNINHLAKIMVDYIDNPTKVTEHSLNSRRRIENDYNWDDRDEQILNLLSI